MTRQHTALKKGSRRAGFTLVELMISMLAGSVVISGVWYMAQISSRMFNEQTRRAETQMTLRTATEALTRDITRAGLLAVRSDAEMHNCNGALQVAPVPVNAVTVTRVGTEQALTLVGNFTTNHQYPTDDESGPNQLVFNREASTFLESFTNPSNGAFLNSRFLSAFQASPAAPRMVSVQDLASGRIMLRHVGTITAGPLGAVSMQINPPLDVVVGCFGKQGWVVSPVSAVRYSIEDPSTDAEFARIAGTASTGGSRRALVRREINTTTLGAAAPTYIPNTARIVADYVNSFRISAVIDVNTPNAPPLLTYIPDLNAAPPANPAAYRSLIIELSTDGQATRTAGGAPLTAEQTQAALAGRRWTRFEVFMPNMARRAGSLE